MAATESILVDREGEKGKGERVKGKEKTFSHRFQASSFKRKKEKKCVLRCTEPEKTRRPYLKPHTFK